MTAWVTALGNAGFQVEQAGTTVLIDPFFSVPPDALTFRQAPPDLILITHDHWDHFNAQAIREAAARWPLVIGGPRSVIHPLRGHVPVERLLSLDPPENSPGAKYCRVEASVGRIRLRAYRTSHGRAHNSYWVEQPGLRWLHDGDNERTQPYDTGELTNLDLLLLCPWQGAGWSAFVAALRPRVWLLQHLDEEEIAQHRQGEFLPALGEPTPMNAEALKAGESLRIAGPGDA